jgi:hypothetical protein
MAQNPEYSIGILPEYLPRDVSASGVVAGEDCVWIGAPIYGEATAESQKENTKYFEGVYEDGCVWRGQRIESCLECPLPRCRYDGGRCYTWRQIEAYNERRGEGPGSDGSCRQDKIAVIENAARLFELIDRHNFADKGW